MEPLISVDSLQDLDNESGQVNTDCLGVPLILREIFHHFSTTDLIQLSLVNKQWNYEARSLMKTRGNLTANINKNDTCQDLRAFASDLRQMKETTKIIPFSGLKISLGGLQCNDTNYCDQLPEREQDLEDIVNGLTWKNLAVTIFSGWREHMRCTRFVLLNKIFQNCASTLEEFSIEIPQDAAGYLAEGFFQASSFTQMRIFRLENKSETLDPVYTELIKMVVSQAPNLQQFYSAWKVDLCANLLEGSSAVHMAGYPYFPYDDEIPESVLGKLRQLRLSLSAFSLPFSLERFNRINTTILDSSRTILNTVEVDVIFLVPLMVYGICLESVKTFELAFTFDPVEFENRQPEIWKLTKCFDFTRLFPKLNSITIYRNSYSNNKCIPDEFNQLIAQGIAMLEEPRPDRAVNIKHLKLEDLPDRVFHRRSSFRLLAQMFPDVEKLSIETTELPSANFRDIWADLKEVDVTLQCSVPTGDSAYRPLECLDSAFCGIFPQEVAHLQEQNEEYLRRVNIVPVMPSIAYLKELRTFKVCYDENLGSYGGPTDDPTCLFSKVTALIAFQRLPNLNLILSTKDERLAEGDFEILVVKATGTPSQFSASVVRCEIYFLRVSGFQPSDI